MTKDGRIVARRVRALFTAGAYAAFKPAPSVNLGGAGMGAGVYRIPHLSIESLCVYTHSIPCGHARSPGEPQMVFAGESHMDMIAKELGLDPAEFRRRNLLTDGDGLANGHHLEHVRAKETLEAALQASDWSKAKPGPRIGRGVAMTHRHIGVGFTNAHLRLETKGTATLVIGLPDTGTGGGRGQRTPPRAIGGRRAARNARAAIRRPAGGPDAIRAHDGGLPEGPGGGREPGGRPNPKALGVLTLPTSSCCLYPLCARRWFCDGSGPPGQRGSVRRHPWSDR